MKLNKSSVCPAGDQSLKAICLSVILLNDNVYRGELEFKPPSCVTISGESSLEVLPSGTDCYAV